MLGKPNKLRPGDELTTSWLNKLLALIQRNEVSLGLNSGLAMIRTGSGTILRSATSKGLDQLAVTASSISAATMSGTGTSTVVVPGSGTAYALEFDASGNWAVDPNNNTTFPVLSFSTTTGGIASQVLVWLSRDDAQNWVITSVDCGN